MPSTKQEHPHQETTGAQRPKAQQPYPQTTVDEHSASGSQTSEHDANDETRKPMTHNEINGPGREVPWSNDRDESIRSLREIIRTGKTSAEKVSAIKELRILTGGMEGAEIGPGSMTRDELQAELRWTRAALGR